LDGFIADPAATEEVVDPADLQHRDLDVVVAIRLGHAVRGHIAGMKSQRDEIHGLGKPIRHDVRILHKIARKTRF
jgi:hypothetical protein